MTQLERNIMNIHEAIKLLDDLIIDDCGSPEYYGRQMKKLEDIEDAMLSVKAYLELQQSEEIRETQGDLVAESYLNSL